MMKKQIALVLIMVILAGTLAGCGPKHHLLSETMTLPGTYLIEMERYSGGQWVSTTSYGCDENQNYYYRYFEGEDSENNIEEFYLNLGKDGKTIFTNFLCYKKQAGAWHEYQQVTEMQIKALNALDGVYLALTHNNGKSFYGTCSKGTELTYLDRPCTSYDIVVHDSPTVGNYTEEISYTVVIDNETGLWLKQIRTGFESPVSEVSENEMKSGHIVTQFITKLDDLTEHFSIPVE